MTSHLSLHVLTPALGAVVEGIDLRRSLIEEERAWLYNAWLEHQVLFFENQPLTPLEHRQLAAQFGPLHIHPIYPQVPDVPEIIVLDTDVNNVPDNDNWHTDVTFIDTPPLGAFLSAKVLPPQGGDTLWASCAAAYQSLSEPFQKLLEGLTAEHDWLKAFPAHRFARTPEEKARWEATREKLVPAVHPVIRTHPVTGRRGLFVNAGFTTRILELSLKESAALLHFLQEHIAKPEHVVRWRWKKNDLAFWDNRLTQHYANADYLPHRRFMHRAKIMGDKPFFV